MGSAPSTANQMVRGIELERVALGVAQPEQQIGLYKDALRRLSDRLHYLNSGNNRFWFDTRPNLRREMEERKRRFQEKEDVFPAIRERLQRMFGGGVFGGIHVFTTSSDVPDDWALRLVVLPPDATFSRTGQSAAMARAMETLKNRGEQPRFKQNRLIFLSADYDSVGRLTEQVRSMLAWQSIVNDIREMKLNLDQYQSQQASKSLENANEGLRRMIRESYKWLLAPMQEARPGKGLSEIIWESFQLNTGATSLSQEIDRLMKENDLLITEWAPIHLARELRDWFWKDGNSAVNALNVWQQSCQQLYLPRLKDDHVFLNTLHAATESRDFFGLAQGKEGDRYVGFIFGQRAAVFLDASLLLIEPGSAATYAAMLAEEKRVADEAARPQSSGEPAPNEATLGSTATGVKDLPQRDYVLASQTVKRQFYSNIEINPIQAKKQFADIVDEVILQFTSHPGMKVKIAIEIEAESAAGFDDSLQRAVKENCNVLGFINAEFEEGE
ncbi:hypothetical protein [Acidithiobacillus thiooxidans]|uniref:hypothetical protein n=1 Tax=Acidithiobacillus thiooxidans TaxID=930 RepID=UPI0018E95C69|nr:hypothetical protein [Acidithiobacillus thiooxidans]